MTAIWEIVVAGVADLVLRLLERELAAREGQVITKEMIEQAGRNLKAEMARWDAAAVHDRRVGHG